VDASPREDNFTEFSHLFATFWAVLKWGQTPKGLTQFDDTDHLLKRVVAGGAACGQLLERHRRRLSACWGFVSELGLDPLQRLDDFRLLTSTRSGTRRDCSLLRVSSSVFARNLLHKRVSGSVHL
jgi:hypothetical protein